MPRRKPSRTGISRTAGFANGLSAPFRLFRDLFGYCRRLAHFEALLQRLHDVDHRSDVGFGRFDNTVAVDLRLNHRAQVFTIGIRIFLRLEAGGKRFHQI